MLKKVIQAACVLTLTLSSHSTFASENSSMSPYDLDAGKHCLEGTSSMTNLYYPPEFYEFIEPRLHPHFTKQQLIRELYHFLGNNPHQKENQIKNEVSPMIGQCIFWFRNGSFS